MMSRGQFVALILLTTSESTVSSLSVVAFSQKAKIQIVDRDEVVYNEGLVWVNLKSDRDLASRSLSSVPLVARHSDNRTLQIEWDRLEDRCWCL